MLLKRWENLNNWAFAGVYITCAILTFTTEESQYRRLLAAFTPAGLSVARGSIAAGAYILAGRSIWGVRLGWKHLNVRWLSMSIIVGALLGASVVLADAGRQNPSGQCSNRHSRNYSGSYCRRTALSSRIVCASCLAIRSSPQAVGTCRNDSRGGAPLRLRP